jgi:hypothetical protein
LSLWPQQPFDQRRRDDGQDDDDDPIHGVGCAQLIEQSSWEKPITRAQTIKAVTTGRIVVLNISLSWVMVGGIVG